MTSIDKAQFRRYHKRTPRSKCRTCEARALLVRYCQRESLTAVLVAAYLESLTSNSASITSSSALSPVASAAEREITTIEGVEGLADGAGLHPVQEACARQSAFQCAYCTLGFTVSTVGLLERNPKPDRKQIRAALSGHICRCGTYPRILKAVETAAELMGGQTGDTA